MSDNFVGHFLGMTRRGLKKDCFVREDSEILRSNKNPPRMSDDLFDMEAGLCETTTGDD
jgi:hypothetical protein